MRHNTPPKISKREGRRYLNRSMDADAAHRLNSLGQFNPGFDDVPFSDRGMDVFFALFSRYLSSSSFIADGAV